MRRLGGLTAVALLAANRLGAKCAYAGVLGLDEASRAVLEGLSAEGVNTRNVLICEGAGPVRTQIVIDETDKSRTIFFDANGMSPTCSGWPQPQVVVEAKAVLIDHYRIEQTIVAARIARAAGVPVISDLEEDEGSLTLELIESVDHLVVPQQFACRISGESDPRMAASQLWAPGRTVVVTCGADGSWYIAGARVDGPSSVSIRRPTHQPAFVVKPIDTTGCGDVFHGAYAAALVRGLELPERVRFASAAAALVASHSGDGHRLPDLAAVEHFLGDRP
jgi:sulfofructose kinase